MTLGELSSAWNELRNAALGRGMTPRVSKQLAARVSEMWEAWRRWYEDQGPATEIAPRLATGPWLDELEDLRAAVYRETGEPIPGYDPPRSVSRTVKAAAAAVVAPLETGIALLAVTGAVSALVFAYARGSRR